MHFGIINWLRVIVCLILLTLASCKKGKTSYVAVEDYSILNNHFYLLVRAESGFDEQMVLKEGSGFKIKKRTLFMFRGDINLGGKMELAGEKVMSNEDLKIHSRFRIASTNTFVARIDSRTRKVFFLGGSRVDQRIASKSPADLVELGAELLFSCGKDERVFPDEGKTAKDAKKAMSFITEMLKDKQTAEIQTIVSKDFMNVLTCGGEGECEMVSFEGGNWNTVSRFKPASGKLEVKRLYSKGSKAAIFGTMLNDSGDTMAVVLDEKGAEQASFVVDGDPVSDSECETIAVIPRTEFYRFTLGGGFSVRVWKAGERQDRKVVFTTGGSKS